MFYGKKNIVHKDGSVWCHVELIGLQTDNFKVDYTPDDETIFRKGHVPSSISVSSSGSSNVTMKRIARSTARSNQSFASASPKQNVNSPPVTRSVAASKASPKSPIVGVNKIASPIHSPLNLPPINARILDGGYTGTITRTKSVKLAKRTAAIQDTTNSVA